MKGIVAKPMPKHWYNEKAATESDDPIDVCICASKKPYFMMYRYPELRSRYLTFKRDAGWDCKAVFGLSIDELKALPSLTEEQRIFVEWYDKLCPVLQSNGVMNRICALCESYFDALKHDERPRNFDPFMLKTGVDYSRYTKDQVMTLYHQYMDDLRDLAAAGLQDAEYADRKMILMDEFRAQCAEACPSEIELCDVVVDICYSKEKSKQFAWDMCGEQMVTNVLRNTGGTFTWPKPTARGDVVYGGKRFRMETGVLTEVNNDERYCFE